MTQHLSNPKHHSSSQTILLSTVHSQLKLEFIELAELADDIQGSLSKISEDLLNTSPATQMSLQSIDRIQQTLKELHSLMEVLSHSKSEDKVSKTSIRSAISLRHLSDKILDPQELHEDRNDVTWL